MNGGTNDLLLLFLLIRFERVNPFAMTGLAQQTRDGWQRHLAVAHHSHIGLDVLVYLGPVDIELYDFRLLGVSGRQSRHTVAETHTDGDEHVTLLRLLVRCKTAVHTQHTHVQRMIGLQGRKTEQRPGGRNIGFLQELEQFVMCITQFHTLPHQRQRSLGIIDQFGGSLHSCAVELGIRLVAAHARHMHRLPFALMHLRILGEVEHHRSWTAATGDIESPTDSPSHILWTPNLIAPFRDRLGNAHEVDLLKSVGSQRSRAHLSTDNDDRRRVHHSVGHTRKRVCGSGAARHDAHTHITADAGKTLGSMSGGLFMTNQNMIELLVFASRIAIERIENRHDGTARIAEDGFHTFLHQRTHQSLRARNLFFHP